MMTFNIHSNLETFPCLKKSDLSLTTYLTGPSSVPYSDTRSFVLLRLSPFCIVEGEWVKGWLLR